MGGNPDHNLNIRTKDKNAFIFRYCIEKKKQKAKTTNTFYNYSHIIFKVRLLYIELQNMVKDKICNQFVHYITFLLQGSKSVYL